MFREFSTFYRWYFLSFWNQIGLSCCKWLPTYVTLLSKLMTNIETPPSGGTKGNFSQQSELISFFRTSSNALIPNTDERFGSRLQEKLAQEANLVDAKKQLTALSHTCWPVMRPPFSYPGTSTNRTAAVGQTPVRRTARTSTAQCGVTLRPSDRTAMATTVQAIGNFVITQTCQLCKWGIPWPARSSDHRASGIFRMPGLPRTTDCPAT